VPGDPLRAAIIGYGHAGSVFHAPLIDATPGLHVAAIVTSSSERAARAQAAYPGARVVGSADLIWQDAADYDMAIVATPNRTHLELGLAALQAGLPVVIDKPMAATVSDAQSLIAAAQRSGKLLTVFHNARWATPFLTARQIISAGLLGPVCSYEARLERFRPVPRPGAWREVGDEREAGGLLYDLGSHLIDQALQLFGPPVEVYAELDARRPGSQVDDDNFVSLRFSSGVRARLWMSYVARLPGPALRIAGLQGAYVKPAGDPQEAALHSGIRPGDASWGVEARDAWGRLSTDINGVHFDGPLESVPGGYEQFYGQLTTALRDGGPPPVNPMDAIATLRVIEAARLSARSHAVVSAAPDDPAGLPADHPAGRAPAQTPGASCCTTSDVGGGCVA
jgi:predicted dehydrogenase